VYAVYSAEVRQVDEEAKERIRREVREKSEVGIGGEAVGRVLEEKRECECKRDRADCSGAQAGEGTSSTATASTAYAAGSRGGEAELERCERAEISLVPTRTELS
jgi:hypothetical protein